MKLPRLACAGCGCGDSGLNWPAHCRSTPGLDELQARLSALMPYRVATELLQHVLPIDANQSFPDSSTPIDAAARVAQHTAYDADRRRRVAGHHARRDHA